MGFFTWANNKTRQLSFIDIKLIAIAGLFLGLIITQLFPSLLDINVWWFVIFFALCMLKVYYVMFFKK